MTAKPPKQADKRGLELLPRSLATWRTEAAFYRPATKKPLAYDLRTKRPINEPNKRTPR